MACRAVVTGVIPDQIMGIQVSTEIQAKILDDGARLEFSFSNDENESGLHVSQFYFSFDQNVRIRRYRSNVPGGTWSYSGMDDRLVGYDYGFGATRIVERLLPGQTATFTLESDVGTFREELLEGLQVCLVYERGEEGSEGFIQGMVLGSWLCDPADPVVPPIDRVVYPFDRSLARMERSLGRLLDRVQENASLPADLPQVERILTLVLLKNQLITILAQESRTVSESGTET